LEKNENEKITFESGVNHSQPEAPSGFSLSRVQEEIAVDDIRKAELIISLLFSDGKITFEEDMTLQQIILFAYRIKKTMSVYRLIEEVQQE
jgi:hypothetical protein